MEFQNYDELHEALIELRRTPGRMLTGVTIGSDLAGEILKAQTRNRNPKEVRANIAKLTRALREGFWNPEPVGQICFYADEHLGLADGQCRLNAVLVSGVPITVNIVLVTTVLGMDEGRPRVLAQELYMMGVAESKTIGAVTRELFYATDVGEGPPSTGELLAFYKEHRSFITECVMKSRDWLIQVLRGNRIYKESQLAILRALAIRQDPTWSAADVDAFLEDAVTGAGKFEMASLVYHELGEVPVQRPKRRKTDMTMAALDYHLRGKTAKRLQTLKNPKKKPTRPQANQADESEE